jgi:hypothetical protein
MPRWFSTNSICVRVDDCECVPSSSGAQSLGYHDPDQGVRKMPSLSNGQRDVCLKFCASYLPCDDRLRIGIDRTFNFARFPINGLRYPPQGDTTEWYIWSGEELSTDADFFVPLHAFHLNDRCPEIMNYFGLGLGWRFLVAPGHEDVWFDPGLLKVSVP